MSNLAALPAHVVFGPWREGLEEYSAASEFPPPNPLPAVLWNFEKFLFGKDSKVLGRFAPDMPPKDPRIVSAIEAALAA
jgi:glutathione peroxidase